MAIKYYIINGYKVCTKCEVNKSIDKYNKCKKTKSGIQAHCKDCSGLYAKKYNLENPEVKKEYQRTNFDSK